jgi:membrane protein YdbS with pleckstrin-like domain
MSEEKTTFNSSLPTLLFIVFLILKLTGNIDWSWWWVTSPLWIPVAAVLVLIVIALVFYNTKK